MDNQVDERQKYIDKLNTDLEKVTAASGFEKTNSGKLIVEILEADITRFTNDLLSDKYVDNHMGYVDARAKANYAASLLSRVSKLKDPHREKDLREKIKLAKVKD